MNEWTHLAVVDKLEYIQYRAWCRFCGGGGAHFIDRAHSLSSAQRKWDDEIFNSSICCENSLRPQGSRNWAKFLDWEAPQTQLTGAWLRMSIQFCEAVQCHVFGCHHSCFVNPSTNFDKKKLLNKKNWWSRWNLRWALFLYFLFFPLFVYHTNRSH